MKTYSDDASLRPHPTRPGWVCKPAPGGSFVGWEGWHQPSIQPHHIDGPLLVFSDSQLHWLTPWERFLLLLGLTDAEKLQRKRRPNLLRTVNPSAGE